MDDDKEIIDDLMKFEELWDYEIFRDILETVYLGSNKSRPNFDPVLMFKIIILEIFYNFNDNKISK